MTKKTHSRSAILIFKNPVDKNIKTHTKHKEGI